MYCIRSKYVVLAILTLYVQVMGWYFNFLFLFHWFLKLCFISIIKYFFNIIVVPTEACVCSIGGNKNFNVIWNKDRIEKLSLFQVWALASLLGALQPASQKTKQIPIPYTIHEWWYHSCIIRYAKIIRSNFHHTYVFHDYDTLCANVINVYRRLCVCLNIKTRKVLLKFCRTKNSRYHIKKDKTNNTAAI